MAESIQQTVDPPRDVRASPDALAAESSRAAPKPAPAGNSRFRCPLHVAALRLASRSRSRLALADSLGTELTGGQLLVRALVLRRALRRILDPGARMVGLLLPPSVGGVLANLACLLLGKVPVNLNYTAGAKLIDSCLQRCQIRQVISSRRFWQRLKLECQAATVFLEGVKGSIGWRDKLAGVLLARLPAALRERLLGLSRHRLDDLATVVFSSGSEGEPKGIMLSHRNILSNIEGISRVVRIGPGDRIAGMLPFFHSFGFTGTMFGPLLLEAAAVYHPDPRDARGLGELVQKYEATILMTVPTFLRLQCRRCEPSQFASLEWVLAAGEKLPRPLARQFQERFGIEPVEGYGCTELSPIVSLNVPPSRALQPGANLNKPGTVGRPIPGVSVKVVNPDSYQPVAHGEEGLLLVSGPNVMMGYLDRPDLTAKAIRDGWYVTGDIVRMDADGFIEITDRLSRFSKIGGEMVPHLRIEEALADLLPHHDGPAFAVTAVPDPQKGERIVVLHTGLPMPPEEVGRRLHSQGLPNLWIPSPDSFFQVEEIPVLGSGKVNLKQTKQLAQQCVLEQRTAAAAPQESPQAAFSALNTRSPKDYSGGSGG